MGWHLHIRRRATEVVAAMLIGLAPPLHATYAEPLSGELLFSGSSAAETDTVEGLSAPVELARDENGVVHVHARNEADLAFAQGYAHARDRLFQMDLLRRTASGTLAELLGERVLADDIELRTVGLRRAAERTLPRLSPPVRRDLDAYAQGVNAFRQAHPVPPEYAALGLGNADAWTPLDSVSIAKLIAFQLTADLDDIDRTEALLTYQQALGAGPGAALFFQDLWRVAPFEPVAITTPGAAIAVAAESAVPDAEPVAPDDGLRALAARWKQRLRTTPFLQQFFCTRDDRAGSNAFVVSGRLTRNKTPLLANDPHLDLSVPSLFYPIELRAPGAGFAVRGASFAGVPYVVQGVTPGIAWGTTANGVDVTDIYRERLVADPASPSGLSTVYRGSREFVLPIPQTFRVNRGGERVVVPVPAEQGGVTLIVPRRNQGPIIARLDDGTALSLQWTGFGPTFELDAFRNLNRAHTLGQFTAALRHIDAGSQNFLYADRTGHIAYVLAGEIPLREDLQAETPVVPPFLIRDGQGGQEWMSQDRVSGDQALPYRILPFREMPMAIDPAAGFLVTANNDPLGDTFDNDALNQLRPGGGIRYLGADFNMGIRARRIEDLIDALGDRHRLSFEDMQMIQADVALFDAEVFVPLILGAFTAAASSPEPRLQALAADRQLAAAVERLRHWRFTTPTGVRAGYDAADEDGRRLPVSTAEAQESVAATLYAQWRAQMIANTIDRTLGPLPKPRSRYAIRALRHLLDSFGRTQGVGASGLNFFAVADVADAAARRDIIVLQSLRDILDRLASDDFAAAFHRSRTLNDYRWGKLHRVEIPHPLGGPFSLTSAQGPFPPPFKGLPGVPTDGGFETVDRANHDVRAGLVGREDPVNDFMFDSAPIDRFVVQLGLRGARADNALPGGISGDRGSGLYSNLFGPWLTNEAFRFGSCDARCPSRVILRPLPVAATP